jgi:hypothetical protein
VEKAVRSVKAGAIAYWPMKDAMLIYRSDAQAYSPVNTAGENDGELGAVQSLKSGMKIRVERA